MASPEDPDATVDAGRSQPRRRLDVERVELPVYRPRRRVAVVFWAAFCAAAVLVALLVWLI